jgi:S-adenosylmethionine hydrolase
MIVLFTDFGLAGPYVGQLKAVLATTAPGIPVIDLFADAPVGDPRRAAYLLAAYDDVFRPGTIFLTVVDPGVGGARPPIALRADGCWYVGPGNGLLELVMRRAGEVELHRIAWQPEHLSASFHGRDLFAPVAARLALGDFAALLAPGHGLPMPGADWPDDLAEIVYIDHYGNALTGLRPGAVPPHAILVAAGMRVPHARVFSDLPEGAACWYVNANGLIEIAVNRGHAAAMLGLTLGSKIALEA